MILGNLTETVFAGDEGIGDTIYTFLDEYSFRKAPACSNFGNSSPFSLSLARNRSLDLIQRLDGLLRGLMPMPR